MNIERMREGLKIVAEECDGNCAGCVFVSGCYLWTLKPIGEISQDILDYCVGGRFYTQKECDCGEEFPEGCPLEEIE